MGGLHNCALVSDGGARCWGFGASGELGDGIPRTDPFADDWVTSPVTVSGLSGAVALTAGGSHTCALMEDGTARCWGFNGGFDGTHWVGGQLGNGTTAASTTPGLVAGLAPAVSIGAGQYHSCALLADDTIRCWGYNTLGQLGNGSTVVGTFAPASPVIGIP